MIIFIQAVNLFFQVILWLILARCVMSFFVRPGDRIYRFYLSLCNLTEPILAPCRNLMSRFMPMSGIDFSPVLTILILGIINRVIVRLLVMFLL